LEAEEDFLAGGAERAEFVGLFFEELWMLEQHSKAHERSFWGRPEGIPRGGSVEGAQGIGVTSEAHHGEAVVIGDAWVPAVPFAQGFEVGEERAEAGLVRRGERKVEAVGGEREVVESEGDLDPACKIAAIGGFTEARKLRFEGLAGETKEVGEIEEGSQVVVSVLKLGERGTRSVGVDDPIEGEKDGFPCLALDEEGGDGHADRIAESEDHSVTLVFFAVALEFFWVEEGFFIGL
jgi:hypothetical protein